MSETGDPEQIKNLVDSCFARLATDVTNHGGRVDKVIGDALMALFGAPIAHEDDAERAVRCALAMQRTIAGIADNVGTPLRLRVGINTGEVLVGGMRAGGDYTAMGDVVNVASRLQTSAEPGKVIVGAATHQATNAVIAYDALGELQTRGREGSVAAWSATASLLMPGRRATQRRSPLVGRDSEIALLRAALTTSLARSRPGVAVMFGEPGVGKTRLSEEVAEMARVEQNAFVLEGRCLPYGEANVWWPVAEAVRQACDLAPDADQGNDEVHRLIHARLQELTGLEDDDPEIDRLCNGLVYVLGDTAALSELDPSRALTEVVRAVEALIQGLARQKPLMVVLSELHWADSVVLQLVDSLLERAVGLPVFLLATARLDFEHRWTPPAGKHNAVAVHLDPLDDEAAAQLLAGLLGPEASAEMTRLVMERAGGNPLFLEELAALLTDVPGEGSTVNDLPATLRGLVAARIDGLEPSARRILDDAAVVGRDGRVDALAALAHARGESLDEQALDELVAREVLSEDAGAWSFRSELVREVAYDTLTKADRARRHAALGMWMFERRQGSGREDEELEPIAHHLGLAASFQQAMGDIEGVPADICPRALRAIEKAAMAAKARGLHSGSVHLLDHALELLDPSDRFNRHRVLLARAAAYASLRNVEPGLADVEAVAADLAPDEDNAWAMVETIRGELLGVAGNTEESIAALERAIALWRAAGDVAHEAGALRLAGMTHLLAGNNDEADQLFTEALQAFVSIGDRQGEAWALQNRAWLSFNRGLLDEADERVAIASKVFEEIGDHGGLSFIRGLLGFIRMFQGRFEEAGDIAEKILAHERDQNDRWSTGMIYMLLSSVRLFTGHPDTAIGPATEAIEVFKALGDVDRHFQARATKARSLVSVGRVDEAMDLLKEIFADTGGSSIGYGVISASVATQLGDAYLAHQALDQELAAAITLGTVADHELSVLAGITALLDGNSADAHKMLSDAADNAANEGQRAYAYGALAIAAAADRNASAALKAADKAIAATGGTYLDRQLAKTGQALAFAQEDDRRALIVADELVARANESTDVIAQATALLVRSSVATALRSDDAERYETEAQDRLDDLGIELAGWRQVFTGAATADSRLKETT